MRLEDFPKFRAERIEAQGKQLSIYGRFDHLTNVSECHSWLLQGTTAYYGDLEALDPVTRTAVFQCWEEEFDNEIFYRGLTWSAGYFDPQDLFLVLDEKAVWEHLEFRVSDAVASPNEDGWRSLRKIKPDEEILLGSHDYIVEGAWDHEHCFICMDQINEEAPTCYYSALPDGMNWWVCSYCHQKWIVPHDIGFMYNERKPAKNL